MKNIILGVTGSVAAIKTQELALKLAAFANVKIVLTAHAEYFVQSQLAVLQKNNIPVLRDQDEWPALAGGYDINAPIMHIELRRWADAMLIAPLDANSLAKIALGFCDNLLLSVVRAWDYQKPMWLCPAMNTFMWENEPTAEHIAKVQTRKAVIIAPIAKKLACQDIGMGAMANVDDIINVVQSHFLPKD